MAWTSYHDALMQEQIALMTEPQWYSQPTITDRLTQIRNELNTAQQTIGQMPTLDPVTGELLRDGGGNIIYETPEEGISGLFSQMQQAQIQGNAANEGRYQQLLTGYGDRQSDILGRLDNYGAQQKIDVGQRYDQARASADQDLTNRGLGNTTVRSTRRQGLGQAETQDLARLNESLNIEELGYRERLSADPLGVIERRTDVTPSLADVSNLALQLGRGSANTFAMQGLGALTQYGGGASPLGNFA